MTKLQVFAANSLTERYGSTQRLRPLVRELSRQGFCVDYFESEKPIWRRALALFWQAYAKAYDILLTQKFNPLTLGIIIIARLRGKFVLCDWDDLDVGLQKGSLKKMISFSCEWLGPNCCDLITTHSRYLRQKAKRKAKAHLVLQGYDPELFSKLDSTARDRLRQGLGFCPNDRVVVYACTFTHGGILDIESVFKAWSETQGLKFLLVGDGPERPQVEHLLRRYELKDRVVLTGWQSQNEVAQCLQSADLAYVYLSSSPANRVRASFKVLEYLAAGLPMVGQLVGETRQRFQKYVLSASLTRLPQVSKSPQVDLSAHAWPYIGAKLAEILLKEYNIRHVSNPKS